MFNKQAVLAISLFLYFGTIATFAYKLQNSVTVTEAQHIKKFFHPYIQCFTMFMGQSLCLIVYFWNLAQNQVPLEQGKKPHSFWIFFIPAFFDSIQSIFGYIGLSLVDSSIWMMFKGASIVSTAIFSKIFINIVLLKRHYAGCGIAIVGVIVLGSSAFFEHQTQQNSAHRSKWFGYIFIMLALVAEGLFYSSQQYLLTKHSINPIQMVGYEGVFGMIIAVLVATILSFIPCSFGQSNCVFNNAGEAFIQLPNVYFREVFGDIELIILIVGGLTAIGIYNLNGLRIIKMFDSLVRALLNISRTGLTWLIGIIITLCAVSAGNKDYQIESLTWGVNIVKVIGFGIIITGTLTYNNLIFKEYFETKQQKQKDEFIQINQEQGN